MIKIDNKKKKSIKFYNTDEYADILKNSKYLVLYDFKDAYTRFKLDYNTQMLFGFDHEGHTRVFTCIPFGLNIAPLMFQECIQAILQKEFKDKTYINHIDDIIFGLSSKAEAIEINKKMTHIAAIYKLKINKKSIIEPVQIAKFCGKEINLENNTITDTIEDIKRQKNTIKRLAEQCNTKNIQKTKERIAGILNWITKKKKINRLQSLMYKKKLKPSALKIAVKKALKKNIRNITYMKRTKIAVDYTITIDGSAESNYNGIGGALFHKNKLIDTFSKKVRPDKIVNIEAKALIEAIFKWRNKIKNKKVLIKTDNQALLYALEKGRSTKIDIPEYIWTIIENEQIYIKWIPTNLNKIADLLSRKLINHANYLKHYNHSFIAGPSEVVSYVYSNKRIRTSF